MYTRNVVGKCEDKTLRGRHKFRQEDTLEMNVKYKVWESEYSVHLAQNMDKWRALYEHGNEILIFINDREFPEELSNC
jgi:hypothetical protein